MRQPTFYIPHGGGPCFFMDWDPPDTWTSLADWLRGMSATLTAKPRAIVVISAHWEEPQFRVTTNPHPPLLFDYYGFPEHTYRLRYDAPGDPELAERIIWLLSERGIAGTTDGARGFDHGVFIPFKLIYPEADIPIVQVSMRADLDPAAHLAAGAALAPLRDDGVLLVGSGLSYHNLRNFFGGQAQAAADSAAFDAWMGETVAAPSDTRAAALCRWTAAPSARAAHPREDHLLPLMVAAGAAGSDRGQVVFREKVMGLTLSAVRFG